MEFSLSPFLIQYGDFGIRYYSLMYLVALLIAYLWMTRVGKYDKEKISDLVLYGFLAVIIGGRLGYVLFYQPQWFWEAPMNVLQIWNGGMSYHGGVIAVILWLVYFVKKEGYQFWSFTDTLMPAVILGTAFGRLGNFLNGELWGRVTDVPWCFYIEGWEGCRHPSQLYQAGANLLTFFVLWYSLKHGKPGTTGALFLILYGIGRSTIEMLWREPSWTWYGLTAGTWLSIPMVLIGLVLLLKAQRRVKPSY